MTHTDTTPATTAAELDDLFMRLAEGDPRARSDVLEALRQAPCPPMSRWPADLREAWQAGLDIGLEGIDPERPADARDLLLALAEAGFDTRAFRDLLAALARQHFADYLDPAGLLTALGVLNPRVPTTEIPRRWRFLAILGQGVHCFDPSHGFGVIQHLDDASGHVRIRYARSLTLPLDVVLRNTVLIQPGSLAERCLQQPDAAAALRPNDALRRELEASLVAVTAPEPDARRSLWVPRILPETRYDELYAHAASEGQTGADNGTTSPTRTWDQARSIEEMAGLLRDATAIPEEPPDLTGATDILRAAAPERHAASLFAECVALLFDRAGNLPWLCGLLRDLGSDALCWQEAETFAGESDRLPGRLCPAWFEATAAAVGAAALAELALALPLRLWPHAERLLDQRVPEETLLLDAVTRAIKRGNPGADALVWLYRNGGPSARLLASPSLLFRTLQRPVRGAFIRARKDLHKLLMDDPQFQRLIMRDGDAEAIAELIHATRHAQILDRGERQSLLVKIVRVFPEARDLVEEKRQEPSRRAVGKVTSVRSFELRRRELERIIQTEIPANARAIAHARSYGDLRENAEFKTAKERQAYLTARRAELENDLHEIRPTDFSDATVNAVAVPGCTVRLLTETGTSETYHLLGLWDSVPELRVLSYDTPLGRLLLGARVGTPITMPSGIQATVTELLPLSDALRQWLRNPDEDTPPCQPHP
ncbi:MAG: GreA/GreB family elongation factor [Lentisphaeria bacterium]|nr:GreA/GreB family elongation factor [Lentisphaeria bacterium]